MADKKSDVPATWNELAEGDEQRLGVSKDVLRKLMQINPDLRGGQSTEDLMKQVKTQLKTAPQATAGQQQKEAPVATPLAKTQPQGDVYDLVIGAKTEFDREMQRLEFEIKRLQEERSAFGSRLCLKLIDQCLSTDPGLTSPKSQFVLQQEKAFLDKLGFSMAKLVERQKSLKK